MVVENLDFFLIFSSLLICALGTLVGLGGGFLLVPFLLYQFPSWSPAQVTATSLFVILFNATAASVVQWRQKRIQVLIGLSCFVAILFPAVLSTFLAQKMSLGSLKLSFAVLLFFLSAWLLFKLTKKPKELAPIAPISQKETQRRLLFWLPVEFTLPVLTTALGIGGGVYRVPALMQFFKLSISSATATSTLVLVASTFAASVANMKHGSLQLNAIVANLVLGALIGAFVGAKLAVRLKAHWVQLVFIIVVIFIAIGLIS